MWTTNKRENEDHTGHKNNKQIKSTGRRYQHGTLSQKGTIKGWLINMLLLSLWQEKIILFFYENKKVNHTYNYADLKRGLWLQKRDLQTLV